LDLALCGGFNRNENERERYLKVRSAQSGKRNLFLFNIGILCVVGYGEFFKLKGYLDKVPVIDISAAIGKKCQRPNPKKNLAYGS
jgi:hypothetical protein